MKKALVVLASLALAFTFVACKAKDKAVSISDVTLIRGAVSALPSGAVMSTGPHGEQASPASDLELTDDEIAKLRAGKYKVAIAFHYAGNDWSTAQQQGLKDQFGAMGVNIISVTSANFKAEQQISDIENALAMKPDAIVSIPVDVVSSKNVFKKASAAGVKIVFMDNCPDDMVAGKDYVAVVSADNYGNGVAAAEVMGDYLGGKGKIGMMFHDANFFVTNQRDQAFKDTIAAKYPDIQIVEQMGFDDENKGAEIGDALLAKHPDLNGIFATWDIPAEGVVSAIKAAHKEVAVTTIDIGNNAAKIISEGGPIKGLGAQRPYDQGVAEAILVGYALLGKPAPGYVALPALKVNHDNVLQAYEEVYHIPVPADIKNAYK
ncbi:MAG: substrate-binding domain-containing protein [Termitinemataceae bacterium]|nr:MAG: substrate-binding domain-containing protein [Termitinemataceae bacterium]